MKKVFYPLACCLAAGVLVSCSGQKKSGSAQEEQSANEVALSYSKSLKAAEMDSLQLPVDADGYITIFDGKTFNGWRGYGKDRVPSKWTIEDGCIKFNGSGGGEAQDGDGGDLIFAHKFKNFELEMEWKVSKGGNSGIFYADILETIFQGIMEAIHEADDLKVYTSGMTNMLKYPELMDSATAEKLLGTFEDIEDKEDFVKYVEEVINKDNSDIEIRIGDENSSEDLKDCSLVTATYKMPEGAKGTIGIIGPKRMDYKKVVTMLKNLTDELDDIFNNNE